MKKSKIEKMRNKAHIEIVKYALIGVALVLTTGIFWDYIGWSWETLVATHMVIVGGSLIHIKRSKDKFIAETG